ncbi:MAG: ABC transporter permease [Deltaproteobacteria bacterium]|nr:ABC transporter permease [Deltaproteobacteria bacterium]
MSTDARASLPRAPLGADADAHATPPSDGGEGGEQAPPAAKPRGILASIGRTGLDGLGGVRDLYSIFVRTLYYVFRGRRAKGALAEQMYAIGNKSLFFVTFTMGCIGMIMVYQATMQTKKVVPELSLVGASYMQLVVRDFAASIGAMMLATRVGAGIAAEIGSMVVTEQVDALRMCAADPVDYLVVPRFLASLVMTVALLVWAGVVMFSTGMLTGYVVYDIELATFANPVMVNAGDVVVGLAKCVAYGAAIPIVSAHSGLTTFGGSEGVGWATTRAVVNSSLAVIVLNFFISTAGLMAFPPVK